MTVFVVCLVVRVLFVVVFLNSIWLADWLVAVSVVCEWLCSCREHLSACSLLDSVTWTPSLDFMLNWLVVFRNCILLKTLLFREDLATGYRFVIVLSVVRLSALVGLTRA